MVFCPFAPHGLRAQPLCNSGLRCSDSPGHQLLEPCMAFGFAFLVYWGQ